MYKCVKFENLIGEVFEKVTSDDYTIKFYKKSGDNQPAFSVYHDQECSEHVYIESIVGDLFDLEGNPILMSESSSNEGESNDSHATWTFIKFATIKGYVDIRFLGTSNGYYSESADLYMLI